VTKEATWEVIWRLSAAVSGFLTKTDFVQTPFSMVPCKSRSCFFLSIIWFIHFTHFLQILWLRFCGNHNSRAEGEWIQCPVDPSQYVFSLLSLSLSLSLTHTHTHTHTLIEPWVLVHVLAQLFGPIHTSTASRSL